MVQPEVKPMAIQPEAFFQQFDDPQLVAADKARWSKLIRDRKIVVE
mgnify:CR=1 FL=1